MVRSGALNPHKWSQVCTELAWARCSDRYLQFLLCRGRGRCSEFKQQPGLHSKFQASQSCLVSWRRGRRAVKCCLVDVIWLFHSWTDHSHDDLSMIKPGNILEWMGRGFMKPLSSLSSYYSSWRGRHRFFFSGRTTGKLPMLQSITHNHTDVNTLN